MEMGQSDQERVKSFHRARDTSYWLFVGVHLALLRASSTMGGAYPQTLGRGAVVMPLGSCGETEALDGSLNSFLYPS